MGQHAGVLHAVEHQVFVDLVADHVDIAAANQRRQAVEVVTGQQRAAGIVRRVDEDQPGPRGDGVAQALPVDGEVRQGQRHVHAAAAGQLHRGLVAVVAGVEDDRLVAGMDQRLHRAEDRLGGAGDDGHLAVGIHAAAVQPLHLGRHLLAQRRQAGHRCVLVVAGGDVPGHRLAQRRRAVEVGEPLGQVERAGFHGELGHAGEDGGADLGQFAGEHSTNPAD
ncbi:hypothetical protein D9M69_503460 [compost metagenome]